jgi:hypothetical protein
LNELFSELRTRKVREMGFLWQQGEWALSLGAGRAYLKGKSGNEREMSQSEWRLYLAGWDGRILLELPYRV